MNKELEDSLNAFIDYAKGTKKYSDLAFYEEIKEHINKIEDRNIVIEDRNMHFNQILHRLNTFYAISMRSDCVSDMLTLIHKWSYAHRMGNGELTEEEQIGYIDKAWYNMINYQVKPLKEVRKSNE